MTIGRQFCNGLPTPYTLHPVRTRYAPSPTGSPHVGNLRTAIYDWLLARHSGGTFIARLEDTDRDSSRYKPESIAEIEDALRFLGIVPDEWWVSGGPNAPYRQSGRLPRYQEIANGLVSEGKAYRCYCTEDRLKEMRELQMAEGKATGYDRHCRTLSDAERAGCEAQGLDSVVRLALPLSGEVTCSDAVFGDVTFDFKLLDDPVILKSNGWPTYHLAAMLDDHDTGITHVMRGEEWLSSAPKHIYLYEALGWEQPVWAHMPLILGSDKKKLSKRHGSTQFSDFIRAGYLPEALFNFLALLGWSPGEENREIFSVQEIVERFTLEGITKHPAVFDFEKLKWMNGEYIRSSSVARLSELCIPHLQEAGLVGAEVSDDERGYISKIIPLVQERMKLLSDVAPSTDFFFVDPSEPEEKGRRKWLTGDRAADVLNQSARWFGLAADPLTEESAELAADNIANAIGIERAVVIHTLRIAVTGRTVGPGLFETLAVLGKQKVLARLERAKSWVVNV